MTKQELVTGMFGVMDDGEVFVVAADKLIFERGQYDDIVDMNDAMEFPNHYVTEVHEATCFKMVKEGRSRVIWKRPEPKTDDGKITITEDEFFEAVKKANTKFMEISKQCPTPHDDIIELTMGMQNMTFGAIISAVLFDKEIN